VGKVLCDKLQAGAFSFAGEWKTSIRGGTDGSRLSFMGVPCPNIFAGEHAFHSRLEWVSVQDMEKAVQTIVHLAMIFEERA
jgi:tripeptide aminopeptidase